jgi:hypothetical protein
LATLACDTRTRASAGTPPDLPPALRFKIARFSDNELILFDDRRRESWILYPPRSRYAFVKRLVPDVLIVEHHPWTHLLPAREHTIRIREGCTEHGMGCEAQPAIQAAVGAGWDPFR